MEIGRKCKRPPLTRGLAAKQTGGEKGLVWILSLSQKSKIFDSSLIRGSLGRMEVGRWRAELASPHGRGAQCAHWAERVFGKSLSVTATPCQLSQRESQGAYGSYGGFA